MNEKKILVAVFSFMAIFLLSSNCLAEIKTDNDSPAKIQDFLLSQPILKTPFTGKEDADLEETYPSFTDPLSNYVLNFKSGGQSFSPGDTISLSGSLRFNFQGEETLKKDCPNCQNSTVYPISEIPDTGLFIQVWRKDDDANSALKGDYLMDEFYAFSNKTIRENEENKFDVNWKIPAAEKAGDYYFSFFINSGKRFTLKGTPLVAFSPAENFYFHLKGEDNAIDGAELDKNNIKINDTSYTYRQPAPNIENNNTTVTIPLTNLGKTEQNVKVTYDLLGWGQEDEKDLVVPEKTENITLASGEKKTPSFSFTPDEVNSVYNLKITASTPTSKSLSNVRFVVKNQNRGIIRFLGMVKNQSSLVPLFCIRNAQWQGTFSGKLKITALTNGKETASIEKSGDFTTEESCFIIKNSVFATKDTANLTIKGAVYNQNNQLVDERTVNYTSDLGKISSPDTSEPAFLKNLSDSLKLFFLILAGILIVAGYFIYRKFNKQNHVEK